MADVKILGRTDEGAIVIKDLFEFLREIEQQFGKTINKEIRKVSYDVTRLLEKEVRAEAASVYTGRRAEQAKGLASGLRAKNDRIPTIQLRYTETFRSRSRPNSKRRTPVLKGDVFRGSEFGGGRRKTTRQFLRHRGQVGYFFWPTVRKNRENIAKLYLQGIDQVVKTFGFK